MFQLRKLFQLIASPLGLAIIFLAAAIALGARRPKLARWCCIGAFLALFPASLPIVSDRFLKCLESAAPIHSLEDQPRVPAIVVLGGTAAQRRSLSIPSEEIGGNRLATAARLYQLGKAPRVIVASGIGYADPSGRWRTESEDMRDILLDLGVPADAIVLESRSQTTKENAVYTAQILAQLDIEEVLMVTSAYHVRRAAKFFSDAGIRVHPVGTGRLVQHESTSFLSFLPSAHALGRSTTALKEVLGILLEPSIVRLEELGNRTTK